MSRYRLQHYIEETWVDQEGKFSTKKQLDEYIGEYNKDFDWRVGYVFKKFDSDYIERFINTKTREEVKP